MKYVTIVMMIFMIHVSISAINAAEIFTGEQLQPSQGWLDDVKSETTDNEYFQSSAVQTASSNFGFGDFVKGLAIFVVMFAFGIVAVPYTFMQFGVPVDIALILSLPVYAIYGLAWAQITANRALKSMS